MATGGLYGQSSAGIVSPQSGSESSGLYGNNTVFGGTYFEWFIFQVADVAPATPTGGSWSFTTNSGTPPTGWLATPPANPTNTVWVSVGLVNSKSTTAIEWSTPGKFSFASGLPIISGTGEPTSGDGQTDQLYIQTGTSPETIWFKQAGTWTRLTGAMLYVDLTSNQTIAGTKTFSSQIQGSISGNAANVTGVVDITHGGTGSTTASAALTALGAATAAQGAKADTAIQTITSTDGSIIVVPTGTSIDLAVSQASPASTLVTPVRNATGATLTKGTVVYISGATGQIATVAKALATSDATSAQTLGMMTTDLANNTNGYVTVFGLLTEIDTSAYADGAQLYLSGTTAGTVTSTKPSAPTHLVYVAVVEYSHAVHGKLLVKVQNGYELEEIHNVAISSPTTGQTITYNSGTSLWSNSTVSLTAGVNGTLPIANGGTGQTTQAAAITALTGTQTNAYYLRSNGTNASLSALSAADLTGTVSIATGGTGQNTANAAFNALAPAQTGNSGKYLTTDGTNTSWATNPLGTVTSVGGTGTVNGITLSGTVTTSGNLTLGGTLDLSSPPVIGGTTPAAITGTTITATTGLVGPHNGTVGATTPNTGAFTTLSASGAVTLSGGTANGVGYLNASKVFTTGNALTFDGTKYQLGVSGSTGATLASTFAIEDYSSTDQFRWTMNWAGSGKLGIGVSGSSGIIFGNATSTTGAVTSEWMRLTSTGLGIWVTPSAWYSDYRVIQSGSTASFVGRVATNEASINQNWYRDTSAVFKYIGNGYAASYTQLSGGGHAWFNGANNSSGAGAALTLTQAMTLDASGNLLVGRTTRLANELVSLQCAGTAGTNTNGILLNYTGTPNDTTHDFLQCVDGNWTTTRASIRSNGGIANYSANNVNLSDVRTKTDIQNAGGYLSKICAIPVRTFKYKDQTDDLLNLGVIAQEVETVAPELVDVSGFGETPEDGVPLKAIYQTDLQYALMKCIQEQQALINAQSAALNQLKARLDAANL